MQTERKKKDWWPLIVGTIAAIGIIGSNSTGGITKTTQEPTESAGTSAVTTASAAVTPAPSASQAAPSVSGSSAATIPSASQAAPSAGDPEAVIRLESITTAVRAGESANVAIIGQPGVQYDIEVAYGNSAGGVSGMEPKTADASGRVSWQWRVPILSNRGKYTITISGGGHKLTADFTVN